MNALCGHSAQFFSIKSGGAYSKHCTCKGLLTFLYVTVWISKLAMAQNLYLLRSWTASNDGLQEK